VPSTNGNHEIFISFSPNLDTLRHEILGPFLRKSSDICLNWIFRIVKEIIPPKAGKPHRAGPENPIYFCESRRYLYGHLDVGRWVLEAALPSLPIPPEADKPGPVFPGFS